MDQYLDNRQKEILWDVLANPADNGAAYAANLERLVQDNPQSGILQLLYARTADARQLSKAVIYGNPRTLHKIVNHPEELAVVGSESIISASEGIAQPDYLKHTATTHQLQAIDASVDADAFDNNGYDLPPATAIAERQVQAPVDLTGEPVAEKEQIAAHVNEEPAAVNEQLEVIGIDKNNIEDTAPPLHDEPVEAMTEEHVHDEPVDEIREAPIADNHNYREFPPVPAEEAARLPVSLPFEEQIAANEPAAQTEPVDSTEKEETATAPQPVSNPVNQYSPRFPKRDMPPAPAKPEPEYFRQDIDDEVYDEIVSIDDIGFAAVPGRLPVAAEQITEARFSDPATEEADEHDNEPSAVLFHQPQPVTEPVQEYENKQQASDEEERLILGGIVNADYLKFDKKLDELRNAAPPGTVSTPQALSRPQLHTTAAETQEMSRYDDDKMPYSFLWWLNKTRKEHAENLQPYAKTAPAIQTPADSVQARPNQAGELQHQYFENIFSLTSVNSIERNTEAAHVAFDTNKKEDVIIERFIHTEPQIKPLSADKLDNENKAKRSSEDLNDFVTETLARIYTDQMLYHKAIATYKKLMLKFPKKNLYFAARIEELEKKTN